MEEGFKELWANMQSMDRTSDKAAYAAGVATGLVGATAGVVFGTGMVFHWITDRYDEFETRTIERIMQKMDMKRRDEGKST